MKSKMIIRLSIDFAMTVLLLLLMARQLTGEAAHEWLGAGMFALWILHHILNFKWYSHIGKRRYTPPRMFQLAVNLLLFISMAGMMISAVILSREVFRFLPISGGISLARSMHILCAFWSFVLMALHLGLHWNMILGHIGRAAGLVLPRPARTALGIAGAAAAVYGLYAFLKNQLLSYLFLTFHFVYFDFERPVILFAAEYMAIMELFVFAGHYGMKALKRLSRP